MQAWSLANFNGTKFEKDFVFHGDVSAWARSGEESVASPLVENLSGLERCVHSHTASFNHSARANEYYRIMRETVPKPGTDIYASMNAMLMNGTQFAHYHPDFSGEYPETSLRIAIVLPASNTDKNQMSGLRFSIFKLEDPLLRLKKKTITGTAISPQHTVYFEPGHIAMIMFRDGVHFFEGNGLITSIHPLDVGANNIGNTYDANTVGWEGSAVLESQVEIKPDTSDVVQSPTYTSLQDVYSAQIRVINSALTKIVSNHNPNRPVDQHDLDILRLNLRRPFKSGFVPGDLS